jgi:menaquinone-dependent protoporphyrinogen oxidase
MGTDPVEVGGMATVIQARSHRMCAGKLGRKQHTRPRRAVLVVFRGLDGDFRDRAQIRQWAGSIAAQPAPTGSPQQ